MTLIDAPSRPRRWTAVLAAYLLVAQAVFAGFVAGQAASAPELAFQILCAPSADAPGVASDTAAHLSGCCSFGCMMAGAALAPPPQGSPAPAPRVPLLAPPHQDMRFAAARPSRDVVGHPRGPPAGWISAA